MRFPYFIILLITISCSKNDSDFDEKSNDDNYKEIVNRFNYFEGLASYSIPHGGTSREYLLYIPTNIQSRTNLPVIFNFHGYSGQADQFFNMTDLVDIADANGVVLVYPQGLLLPGGATHWNAAPTNGSSPSFINKSNVDDIGFFHDVQAKPRA